MSKRSNIVISDFISPLFYRIGLLSRLLLWITPEIEPDANSLPPENLIFEAEFSNKKYLEHIAVCCSSH
jgi:hypothetical protein